MKVERTGTDRVSSSDSTAAPRASSAPFEGGLAVVSVTVLKCLHQHPVRGVTYRPHGATLGSAEGEHFPTGRILKLRPAELAEVDLEPGHALAYCPRCKAATEYRRAA